VGGIKAVYCYFGVHYTVEPVASSENNTYDWNLTFCVWDEWAVVYAYDANFGFDDTEAFMFQNSFPLAIWLLSIL